MKKKYGRIIGIIASVCSIINIAGFSPANAAGELKVADLNYKEQTGYNLGYSDCGYSSALWINAKPGKIWTVNPSTFSLLLIDIGGYSGTMNGKNVDYDLDSAFFESLEESLKNARMNGVTTGIRLRYDSNGTNNPEPLTFQKVLDHIAQLGESNLLYEYEDVVSFVETGMVGAWGEQWGGKYVSLNEKAQVLDAFLDIVPSSISVAVRTPNTVREWLSVYCGINTTAADMSYNIEDPVLAAKAEQIGLYNDGYMGSDSDLGTFSNRKGELEWLAGAASYGGEFSGADEFRLGYDTWQPQNALPEMYYSNLMRINGNIYRTRSVSESFNTRDEAQARLDKVGALYQKMGLGNFNYDGSVTEKDGKYTASWKWMGYDDFTFDSALDEKLGTECDNSAFYGETVWQYMRAHLGYRFVLRSSAITESADPGEKLNMEFTVDNTGFSEAPKDKEVEVLLSNGNVTYTYTTDINAGNWMSGTANNEKVEIKLPETMSGGEWKVYLRISALNEDAQYDTLFCNRFANEELQYDEMLQANYMGSINISGEADKEKVKYDDKRAPGYYPENPAEFEVDNSGKVSLLDRNYTFTENDHYGFTFLYKISGVTEPMQLGKWYLSFTDNNTGYSSAYTTYGLNIRNQEISQDGYYALSVPFYSAVFNFDKAATAGLTKLTGFSFNDSRNFWSDKTYTQMNGNSGVKITPVGFVEGSPEGYNVTYHLPSGDVTYSGSYGFTDVKKQNIVNSNAVTALSLLNKEFEREYTDKNGGVYTFVGFTTKKDDKSCIINDDFIALGDIELYPYYEYDKTATDFNQVTYELYNGMDSQGIRYKLDETTLTAVAGDGSVWENNSAFSESGSIIIPAYVTSGGKNYKVTGISDNAFGSNIRVREAILPDTVKSIGKNAFYKGTVLYVYEGSVTEKLLKDTDYTVITMESERLFGDVNSDGKTDNLDYKALSQWLLTGNNNIDGNAADMNKDSSVNIFDLIMLKRFLSE